MKKFWLLVTVGALTAFAVAPAGAALIDLGPGSFTPQATMITFSEKPLGSQNPVYNLNTPDLGAITVSFGPNFQGQTVISAPPPALPGVKTITGSPTLGSPLSLAVNPAYPTFITNDGANPSSPVLSGTPIFSGPISVLFSKPVAAVGLEGGFFDAVHSTVIEAYGADGTILGSITNSILGLEFYGLADASGKNVIAGISFYITGAEPFGFAIDDVTFGSAAVVKGVPEPGTILLLGSGLIGLAALRRRS